MEYNLQADNVSIKSSTIVRLTEHFTLMTTDKAYDLVVDIQADFEQIPEEFHEVFVNMLTTKYLNKVSFGHNPFSQCIMKEKRWFQFWKK